MPDTPYIVEEDTSDAGTLFRISGDDAALAMAMDDLRLAREASKAAKDDESTAREEVLKLLAERDEDDVSIAGAGRVWIAVSERTGVDRSRLEALYPEVFAAVKTTSEVRTVRLSEHQ